MNKIKDSLLAMAALAAMADKIGNEPIYAENGYTPHSKTPLNKKQKKVRAKNKRASKSRRANR